MSLKSLARQNYVNKSVINSTNPVGTGLAAPVITSLSICDSSYNVLDDTALDPAGSYVKINGTGFITGCTVYFNNATVTTTFVSSTEVRVQTPATSVGAYTLMLFNPNNLGGAIYLNLSVSSLPTFTTTAGSIGSYYEANTISNAITATGDTPLTYSLYSGSLPTGATLNSNGTITGTSPADSGTTTYSFVVNVKDAQNQDATRSFSLTINTDPVTWTTPASNGIVYTSYEYANISNVTLLASTGANKTITYSANALPGGITLSGNTISGSNNLVGNTYTRLTATAATTGRTNTRDVVFNVAPDIVTWSSPADTTQYVLAGGSAMANVSLVASSAAGQQLVYSANTLPAGTTISGNAIYGTPSSAQSVFTLLTATANVTNRSATRYISWVITLGDTYFKYTTLALNSSTTANTFINDSSNNNFGLTIAGDTKGTPFNPYQEGYYSNYFDGTGDYLTLPSTSGFAFGTKDFTIECWIYVTSTTNGNQSILSSNGGWGTGAVVVKAYHAGFISLSAYDYNAGGAKMLSYATPMNQWVHVAITRSGTTFTLYVNGTNQSTVTSSITINFNSSGTLIGYNGTIDTTSSYMTGYISNLRVVKGTAVYTSGFTPSTTPLTAVSGTTLLTCQSNRFIDNSNSAYPITRNGDTSISQNIPFTTPTNAITNTGGYSVGFNSNWMETSAANAAFNLYNISFTLEGWFYFRSLNNGAYLFSIRPASGSNYSVGWYMNGTAGQVDITFAGASGGALGAAGSISTGSWQHIGLGYTSATNTMTMYVNGIATGTSVNYLNGISNYDMIFGIGNINNGYTNALLNANVSNVRVIRGQNLFSGNFTPSTSPLTRTTVGHTGGGAASSITGTVSLLTCQDSKILDNSTNAFNFTTTTDGTGPRITTSYPFTQNTTTTTVTSLGSAYFDGTGDYLTTPDNVNLQFGTGDFTVECWIYPTSISGAQKGIISKGSNTTGWELRIGGAVSSGLDFSYTSTAVTSAFAVTLNTWHHVALTRSGTSMKSFLNGVNVGTATVSDNFNQTDILRVGDSRTANQPFTGYISDIRIVKGTAVYTSNFVPPQTPITPVANTQLLTCQTNGGGNNYGVVDNSPFQNILTRAGNTSQGSFSPYSVTGWSNYFGGTGDYLTTPITSSGPLDFGSGNWTVEAWVMYTGASLTGGYRNFLTFCNDSGLPYIQFGTKTSTGYVFAEEGTPSTVPWTVAGTTLLTSNVWHHIAAVRNSNNIYLYLDGVLQGSVAYSGTHQTFAKVQIGSLKYSGSIIQDWTGYIANVRIVKGTAVYTSAFTPSTTPLTAIANTSLLTCQSNRFIDNSPNNFALTNGGTPSVQAYSPFGTVSESTPLTYSTYFNGSTDYLTVPSTIDHAFGTGDFTVEFWAYPTVNARQDWIDFDSGQGYRLLIMYYSNALGYYPANSVQITGPSLSLNTWYHIAVVRISGSSRMYVNGTQVGSTYADTTNFLAQPLSIGKDNAGSTYVTGYMSNVRITKGKGIYTGNFTVPTSPLAVTQSSSANTAALSIPTNGNSVYFKGGAADYLTVDARYGQLNLLGDFTVELWFCETDTTPSIPQFASGTSGGFACGINAYDGNATRKLDWRATGSAPVYGVTAITTNVWHHAAYVKSGSTFRIFLDGKLEYYNGSYSTTFTSTATYIGSQNNADAGYSFRGYISNFRVVKGTAVYTTSSTTVGTQVFTPSITPLAVTQSSSANTAALLGVPTNGNSVYFNGSTDYITVPTNIDFKFGVGNYTIETWIYPTSVTGLRNIININAYTDGLLFRMNAAGLELYTNGTQRFVTTTGITINTWNHVALVRNTSGACTVYLNGTVHATFTDTASISPTTATVTIGMSAHNSSEFWVGYMSNLRVIKGVAVYTGAFTSPTAPLAVTQSSSANTAAITGVPTNGSSVSFSGTSDYLQVASNAVFAFPGAFTVEGWFYWPTIPAAGAIIGVMVTNGFQFYTDGSTYLGFNIFGSGNVCNTPSFPSRNVWHHIAMTRDGSNNCTIWVDGVSSGTGTSSFSFAQGAWSIYGGSSNGGTGYVSNLRVTKGTALYTTAFTPSTTPLTAITNTQLLTVQGNGFIDGSNNNFSISITGNPIVIKDSPFGNTVSLMTCQANTIIDNSNNNSSITSFGVPTVSKTFSPFGNTASLLTCQGTIFGDNSNDSLGISATGSPYVNKAISPFGYSPQILLFNSPTIINNSSNTYTFTVNGSPKVYKYNPFGYTAQSAISYTPSIHGGSAYFDGTGDYITSTNSLFAFGASNDFTAECWVYFTTLNSSQSPVIISVGNSGTSTGWQIYADSNNGWGVRSNFANVFSTANPPKINQWYHVAYVRKSGTHYLFVNGVLNTTTSTSSYTWSDTAFYSGQGGLGNNFYGYVSDVRLINGTGLYTSNFVPPTQPLTNYSTNTPSALLLNFTNGGIIDQHSTNVLETVGNTQLAPEHPFAGSYYSNYFDGASDSISFAGTVIPTTGNFTLEGWYYVSSSAAALAGYNSSGGFQLYYSGTYVTINQYGFTTYTASTALPKNQWVHLAVVRNGSTWYLYQNGVAVINGQSWNPTFTQGTFNIGDAGAGTYLQGYVSNFRITTTVVYPSGTSFTPPTAPLTAISGTSVLTCQSNKFIDNSTNAFTITKNGDTAVKTFNPFQNNSGKSIYFDGSGDQLTVASPNQLTNFGTGDFTVEFWIYLNAVPSGTQCIFTNPTAFYINFRSSGTIGLTDATTVYATTASALTSGSWFHIAVVRSSGSSKIYTNGVGGTAVACSVNWTNTGTAYIGGDSNGTINGYIRDLRITKGYARYTSNNQVDLTQTFQVK
jgi:hypothetical protein